MKLYIAEKPSLGRAIADVLPKPHKREEGCIRLGNGDVVSWCIGHLLEQAEPEAYDPAFKTWKAEHLPIVPDQWQLQAKTKTRKQLGVLRKLIKDANSIVHAGDPDREGQLLVDQVIDFLKVKSAKKASIQRCLISDLNPAAVTRALGALRPNQEFIPLSTSALARSRADWLYGINMTRAYTLQGRKAGYDGLLSVGRVQTPVLGMVVRRDIEIENFVSRPYYEVLAHLECPDGNAFKAKWKPSEACLPHMDEHGRVLNKALAQNVVNRITDKPGTVKNVLKKPKSQVAPLPYSLSSLQIDAAKRFGLSAKQVLDICQALYERHKLITYPRSDSRYLPVEHFKHGATVVRAIGDNSEPLRDFATKANTRIRGRAWNDSKVDAHHAIIPTAKRVHAGSLSTQEQQIYELVGRQYLAQFYDKWEYTDTTIELSIEGGLFIAKARSTRKIGWKALFPKKTGASAQRTKQTERTKLANDKEEFPEAQLPDLNRGDIIHSVRGELLEKATQPPNAFNDATLLAAMTGISRFVSDPNIRKILKETDGLGTEATRAGIIELLFKRKLLLRKGKKIQASIAARALVDCLPLSATTPDMTAQWESRLNAISQSETSYSAFMEPLTNALYGLIEQSQASLPSGLKSGPGPKTYKSRSAKARPASARSRKALH